MATKRKKLSKAGSSTKKLRGWAPVARQFCQSFSHPSAFSPMREVGQAWVQAPVATKIAAKLRLRLDCKAAMLQAISIGKGFPMLEPWIIDEIRRREEERRRGERPQLELPVPQRDWQPEGDFGDAHQRQGDDEPERGVVIIGM